MINRPTAVLAFLLASVTAAAQPSARQYAALAYTDGTELLRGQKRFLKVGPVTDPNVFWTQPRAGDGLVFIVERAVGGNRPDGPAIALVHIYPEGEQTEDCEVCLFRTSSNDENNSVYSNIPLPIEGVFKVEAPISNPGVFYAFLSGYYAPADVVRPAVPIDPDAPMVDPPANPPAPPSGKHWIKITGLANGSVTRYRHPRAGQDLTFVMEGVVSSVAADSGDENWVRLRVFPSGPESAPITYRAFASNYRAFVPTPVPIEDMFEVVHQDGCENSTGAIWLYGYYAADVVDAVE